MRYNCFPFKGASNDNHWHFIYLYPIQFSLLNALYRAWHSLKLFLVPWLEIRALLLSLWSTRWVRKYFFPRSPQLIRVFRSGALVHFKDCRRSLFPEVSHSACIHQTQAFWGSRCLSIFGIRLCDIGQKLLGAGNWKVKCKTYKENNLMNSSGKESRETVSSRHTQTKLWRMK